MSSKQKQTVGNLYKYIPKDFFSKRKKPQVIEIKKQQKTTFHKNWFITIDGQKYFYTFDKNERIARYYKNGKLVKLDIVKEYKKKHKTFEQLKNTGKHYVFKSASAKKVIEREFSDLGGMYFRMSRKDKNRVSRPNHPSKPYVTLWKNGKKFYKKRSELTADDKLLMMPPPPPPNASKEELKKFKASMRTWRERTGQKPQIKEIKPVSIKVIKRKEKDSKPQIREIKPVKIEVIKNEKRPKVIEIIETPIKELQEVIEVREIIEVKEDIDEKEVEEVIEVRELIELKEVVEVEERELIEEKEVVEVLKSDPRKIDNKVRIATLLKYIKKLDRKGAKFSFNNKKISYKKAKFLIRKKGIQNIYAQENKDKTITVKLSDIPFIKEI